MTPAADALHAGDAGPGPHATAAPLGTAPLGTTPLGTAPLGTASLGTAPLGTAPLGAAPLGSDEALLQAIAEGDREALGALYSRFAAPLVGLARRTLASQEEAEDTVHDVFLEVWRRAGDYDPVRGSVFTWLAVRTRCRALDRLKAPGRARSTSLDEGEGGLVDDLTRGGWDETPGLDSALVWRVLGDLPSEQRAVVELAYFEGLTLAEIGEILNIPIGTAKSRLFRAMARLRATIGEGGSPG